MGFDEQQTWVVTGAGGFVGSAVVQDLLRRGAAVRALMGPEGEGGWAPPPEVHPRWGDIANAPLLAGLIEGADGVIHLAGPPSVAASFANPHGCVAAHTAGTAALLGVMARAHCRRLVYISSAEVYGCPDALPVQEAAPLRPRSPYGAAKVGAEALVGAACRAGALSAIILRPTSVYGPGQSLGGLFGDLLGQLHLGRPLAVRDPRPQRDFVFIGDVARAITAAAASIPLAPPSPPLEAPRIFNVGTGQPTSIAELAATLAAAADVPTAVRESDHTDRPAAADIPALTVDIKAIGQALGWAPTTTLESGLIETVHWYRTSEETSCNRAS